MAWHPIASRRARRWTPPEDSALTFKDPPPVGAPAPDFALATDRGETFRLSDRRGRPVVVYFYPEDDSGGCTTENLEFSYLAAEFATLGADLVGISPDEVERHARFRDKYGLTVTLLADPTRKTIRDYGLWQIKKLYGREFEGVVRASFLINAEGRIAAMVRATRIKGHAEAMLATLRAHLAAS